MTPLPSRDLDVLLAHVGWVRSLAMQLCGDVHRAEDATQATWVAATQRPPRDRGRVRSYLAHTLRNVLRMQGRSSKRRELRESEVAERGTAAAPSTSELVERAELHRSLVAAVLELPESQCEIVLRHYFDGEDLDEVATRLGRSRDAVRALLRRARERLRGELERRGVARALVMWFPTGPAASVTALAPAVAAGAFFMQWKLVLGAAALVAAACLIVPVVSEFARSPAAPPVPGASGAVVVADVEPPASPASPVREAAAAVRNTSVRGCLVGVHPHLPWSAPITVQATWRDRQEERLHHQQVDVGPDGAFATELPGWTAECGALRVRCSAEDPWYAPVDQTFDVANREGELQLRVEPVPALLGQVIDGHNAAVAEARVLVFGSTGGVPKEVAQAAAQTVADGTFRLRLPSVAEYFVVAVAPDARTDIVSAGIALPATSGVAGPGPNVLPETAPITGSVRWANGGPVASATVEWRSRGAVVLDSKLGLGWRPDGSLTRRATARADAFGRFMLPAVAGEKGVVLVSLVDECLPGQFSMVTAVAPQEVELKVEGRPVTIQVLADARPAGAAGIEWRRDDFAGNYGTDANGELRLIVLDAVFRVRAVTIHGNLASEWSEFPNGPPDRVVLQLLPTDGDAVVVRLDGAVPLSDVGFQWRPTDGTAARSMTVRAVEGRFTMRVPSGSYRVHLRGVVGSVSEYLLPAEHEVVLPASAGEVRLPVQLGGMVRLVVTDATGAFIAGTYRMLRGGTAVNASRPGRGGVTPPPSSGRLDVRGPHVSLPFAPGSYEVVLDLGTHGERRQVVEVVPGQTIDLRIQLP